MKEIKLLFCVFVLFTLSACQQDDLDTSQVALINAPKTKGLFDQYLLEEQQPVYKLLGMPVYIVNRGKGSSNGAYLTANSNYTVTLEAKNSSKNQKWIIDPYDKTVISADGGSDGTDALVQYSVYSFDMISSRKYLGMESTTAYAPSLITKDYAPYPHNPEGVYSYHQWRFYCKKTTYPDEWFPNDYVMINQGDYRPSWKGDLGGNGSVVNFIGNYDNYYNYTELWEIQPAENFRLDKLTWSLDAGDVIKALPAFMDQIEVKNNSAAEANMTATFNRKASETSTFTNSVGSQVQVNTSAEVGVPLIASSKIDITTTTSADWQWGSSETHEDTRTYSFNIKVPAYTSVTAKIMVQLSQLSANYTADFVGEVSGKSLRLSGKWEGVQAGNIYYEIIDNKTKSLMKSFNGVPKSTVILNK